MGDDEVEFLDVLLMRAQAARGEDTFKATMDEIVQALHEAVVMVLLGNGVKRAMEDAGEGASKGSEDLTTLSVDGQDLGLVVTRARSNGRTGRALAVGEVVGVGIGDLAQDAEDEAIASDGIHGATLLEVDNGLLHALKVLVGVDEVLLVMDLWDGRTLDDRSAISKGPSGIHGRGGERLPDRADHDADGNLEMTRNRGEL